MSQGRAENCPTGETRSSEASSATGGPTNSMSKINFRGLTKHFKLLHDSLPLLDRGEPKLKHTEEAYQTVLHSIWERESDHFTRNSSQPPDLEALKTHFVRTDLRNDEDEANMSALFRLGTQLRAKYNSEPEASREPLLELASKMAHFVHDTMTGRTINLTDKRSLEERRQMFEEEDRYLQRENEWHDAVPKENMSEWSKLGISAGVALTVTGFVGIVLACTSSTSQSKGGGAGHSGEP